MPSSAPSRGRIVSAHLQTNVGVRYVMTFQANLKESARPHLECRCARAAAEQEQSGGTGVYGSVVSGFGGYEVPNQIACVGHIAGHEDQHAT